MRNSEVKRIAKAVRQELLEDAELATKVFVQDESKQLQISDWEMAVSMVGVTLSTYGVIRTLLALLANLPVVVREFAWGRGSPR